MRARIPDRAKTIGKALGGQRPCTRHLLRELKFDVGEFSNIASRFHPHHRHPVTREAHRLAVPGGNQRTLDGQGPETGAIQRCRRAKSSGGSHPHHDRRSAGSHRRRQGTEVQKRVQPSGDRTDGRATDAAIPCVWNHAREPAGPSGAETAHPVWKEPGRGFVWRRNSRRGPPNA